MAKKKVVDNSIYNFDIIKFFRTGKKERTDNSLYYIDENILYVDRDFYEHKLKKRVPIGIKSGDFIVVNGDEIEEEAEEARDNLQEGGDKEITTSFTCLENAGIKLEDIKVIQTTKDLRGGAMRRGKKFKDFEKTVPQGATYHEGRYGSAKSQIEEKWYHRAGSMLITYKGTSYICGMDEESYFVSKLKTSPKNVDTAFKSLKPKKVIDYEKQSGKLAPRQGEWFFVPMPNMEATAMKQQALPLQTKGGNEHVVESYEKSKGRHYCMNSITHSEHETLRLDGLHEAIQNTASGSWSVQGVD